MSIDKELVEVFRQELQSGFQIIGSEMKQGLDSFKSEVSTGFKEVTSHISQTNARLDETNARLEDFRLEVSSKLHGITRLILASEDNVSKLGQRINRLEQRVGKVERRDLNH